MLVKFLARGTGLAQAAADYLTRETDSQGEVRDDVAVLRGDPDQVAAVADALAFEHKYTSGVIAWAPEDEPSDKQIDRVLDEFEKTAWSGLEPDRYAWAAVRHREADGGVHVHVLAARCDLETGQSLNIAPPDWEQTYGPLGVALNIEHAWSRPDDPARVQQPRHRAYLEAADLRAGIAPPADPRDQIRDYLMQRVEHGTVQDRAGVVAALKEAGFEVPRAGKHYVTARNPETGDRWRLKGALYEHDFQRERLERPAPAPDGDRGPGDERDRRARAADVWRDVETLSGTANDKLIIAVGAMEAQIGWIHGLLLRAWLRPLVIGLVVGLSLFLGICGGSWVLMQWQSSRVQLLVETREALQLEIAQAQMALDHLQAFDRNSLLSRSGRAASPAEPKRHEGDAQRLDPTV